jgi:hypothetical protein
MACPLLDATAMPCPQFRTAGVQCRCAAVVDVVVPSLHERERFCKSDRSRECPIFQAYARTRLPVSEDEYWRIWLSPPADEPTKELHTPEPHVCM